MSNNPLPKCRRLALRSEILAARDRVMRAARDVAACDPLPSGSLLKLIPELRNALSHLDRLKHEMKKLGGTA